MNENYIKLTKKQSNELFDRIYDDNKFKIRITALEGKIQSLENTVVELNLAIKSRDDLIENLQSKTKIVHKSTDDYISYLEEKYNVVIKNKKEFVEALQRDEQLIPNSQVEIDDGEIYISYN